MYKCDNCGYESPKYFGLCPKCHGGMGKEIQNIEISQKQENQYRNRIGIKNTDVMSKIKAVDRNVQDEVAFRKTKFPNFNSIISSANGFIEGQMIALGAEPGVGKSTLCTVIASDDTLYISSEENWNQVNKRALRVNPNCNMDILSTTSFDELCDAIRKTDKKIIIIDSINSIEFGVGYATTAKFAAEVTDLIKEYNKICIMICQVTKSGEIAGMQSLIHVVDTVLHMERSETSNNIILVSSKNRFGEIGSIAVFRHKQDGFEEINLEDESTLEPSIGSTVTETKFGHKNLKINVESLVATAQSSYGLRKSNGYNQNRLFQLIGIISYYGKIDLTEKDIYVNISNGLSTDDICIELSIINSILSSYYNKAIIKFAKGEVRLNGQVIDGVISDKNNTTKIKHINDLISLYKNKREDKFYV